MLKEAFQGVKIVDFCWVGVGPLTMNFLNSCGAIDVRIESSVRPDGVRSSPPYKDDKPGLNRSGYWTLYNANKYSITIDLKHPRSMEVITKLVEWGDIVAENFRPGTMESFGLSYENLKKINPSIIMYRASNQGITGPCGRHPGFASELMGLSGIFHFTGWPDRSPVPPSFLGTDAISPMFGAAALIAALDYRRKTGKGQCLDLSQFEASLQFMSTSLLDANVNGREEQREGNTCSYAAPHGVFQCKGIDRWCAITVFTDEEWRNFCKAVGSPGWTEDSKYSTISSRKTNEEELNKHIEAWTKNLGDEEVMHILQEAGIAAGVVQTSEDVILRDPQIRERNRFWELNHPEIGPYRHAGNSFQLGKTPPQPKMAAPCLGEHTEYVCREFLGMSDEQFVELINTGVFE